MKRYTKNHIVIVDDNFDYASLVEAALKLSGFKSDIKVICKGSNLQKWLNTHELPSLIILDINMPECSGFDVLRMLKEIENFKEIPVVILSVSDQVGDVKKCYAYGANTYIIKPMNFQELQRCMKSLSCYWVDIAETPISGWLNYFSFN